MAARQNKQRIQPTEKTSRFLNCLRNCTDTATFTAASNAACDKGLEAIIPPQPRVLTLSQKINTGVPFHLSKKDLCALV